MLEPREVPVTPRDLDRYRSLIPPDRFAELQTGVAEATGAMSSRALWNISSTEVGGGVAEMLHAIVGYALGTGVTARWLVIEGDHDFFAITKRIHNRLHGAEGDEGDLEVKERAHYEEVLEENGRIDLSANCAGRRRRPPRSADGGARTSTRGTRCDRRLALSRRSRRDEPLDGRSHGPSSDRIWPPVVSWCSRGRATPPSGCRARSSR